MQLLKLLAHCEDHFIHLNIIDVCQCYVQISSGMLSVYI